MKVPDWLVRTFRLGERRTEALKDPVEVIKRELAKPPEAYDLGALVPILVPNAFSDTGMWPGPIHRLAAPGFDQTWAVLGPDDVMVYVSRAMQALWERDGVAWREIATCNLRGLAETEPYNYVFNRDDGTPFMVTMLYGQSLGPSRLLVPGLLDPTFPGGYLVAVPEQTCAVAFTLTPTTVEAETIDGTIKRLFEKGREPVSSASFKPDLLWNFTSGDLGLPG